MSGGDDLGPLREKAAVGLHVEAAVVADGHDLDDGADALGGELPGHDVAVMLQRAQQDLVARLEPLTCVAVGDEVDALAGAALEDDLFLGRRVDEAAHLFAHRFVGRRRPLTQGVDAAMDVGAIATVVVRDGVDHRLRFERRRPVVEVDQRMSVDLLIEGRDLGPQSGEIQAGALGGGAHALSSRATFEKRWARKFERRCLSSSIFTPSMTSLAKAKVRRSRAAAPPIPRERR